MLARLGFAETLIDQGKPAMAILDDALAYSDDERIERMFDVLAQASAKMQIFDPELQGGLVCSARREIKFELAQNKCGGWS